MRSSFRNDSANTSNLSMYSNSPNDKLLSKRSSLALSNKSSTSLKIRPSLLSRKYSGDPNRSTTSNNLNRSIKEFSYFDWSKVKLYENENKFNLDQINSNFFSVNNSSFINVNNTSSSSTTIETKSSYSNETNSQKNNYNISNKNNELPQVITIRYT